MFDQAFAAPKGTILLRLAILLVAPLLLGSCARGIRVLIENKSFDDVKAIVTVANGTDSQWIRPERARWMMGGLSEAMKIGIEARKCTRIYEIGDYTGDDFWVEPGQLDSVRFFVDREGDLNWLRPDAEHRFPKFAPPPAGPRTRKLRWISQRCRD